MRGARPRIAIGRLRRAALLACMLTACVLGIEAVLLNSGRSPQPPPQDRSKEFAFGQAINAGPEVSQTAIEGILAEPLFVQGRGKAVPPVAAAVPAPEAAPPPAPEPEIRLVGVQLSEKARLAIIQLSDSADMVRAVEGQPVAGWVVERILNDHVELMKESKVRSVYLGDTTPPEGDEAINP